MWKLGIGTLLAVATHAYAEPVQLAELPNHVTQASVVINASPDDIYELVTTYRNWGTILSDIRSVTVEDGDRDNARVRFKSRAIGRTVTVQFDNVPGRSISFRGVEGPPGGRSSGEYDLVAIDGGKRTRVTASLYMNVVGAAGVFVSDGKLRKMRQAKLRADLGDITRYFANR
jgi:uncharacterized membrane protein